VSTLRIRIVFPVTDSPVPRFVGWSATIHILGLMALLFLPRLFAPDRPDLLPTLDVVLISPVAGPPKGQSPVTAPTPPPQKKTPPPQGPSAVPVEPPKPRDLPPEKPIADPKPQPVEAPPTPAPAATDPQDPGEAQPDEGQIDAGGSSGPIGNPDTGAALEGMGAEFDWYRDAVVRALFTAWRRPFARGLSEPLEVAISFEILRDGTVRGVQIASPSGDSRLDRSAFRAVQEASLPPLPRNYRVDAQAAQFAFRLYPENDF